MAEISATPIVPSVPEKWRPVVGHPRYRVSDQGRVARPEGALKERVRGHALAVTLYLGNREYKTVSVHRLVLEAFVGPMPDGQEVSHLNGDFRDNRLANLIYESHADNLRRKIQHGTHQEGGKNGRASLTDEQAREIFTAFRDHSRDFGTAALARRYGVCPDTIRNVLNRERYASATADLPAPKRQGSSPSLREKRPFGAICSR